jgi:GntR family galactonate operon transcriptional repressor
LLYIHDVVNVAMRSVRDLHTHSIAHNKASLPLHEDVTLAIRRGHHRKAEQSMRAIVEIARSEALQSAMEQDVPDAAGA